LTLDEFVANPTYPVALTVDNRMDTAEVAASVPVCTLAETPNNCLARLDVTDTFPTVYAELFPVIELIEAAFVPVDPTLALETLEVRETVPVFDFTILPTAVVDM
jgi:hypothetical protein